MGEDGYIMIKVFRFDPSVDAKPRYDSFQVPYDKEETILGILKYITQRHDPNLGFRESCRIGNCGICSIKVNGKGVLACRKALGEFNTQELVFDPLHENKVIRDLVCEIS